MKVPRRVHVRVAFIVACGLGPLLMLLYALPDVSMVYVHNRGDTGVWDPRVLYMGAFLVVVLVGNCLVCVLVFARQMLLLGLYENGIQNGLVGFVPWTAIQGLMGEDLGPLGKHTFLITLPLPYVAAQRLDLHGYVGHDVSYILWLYGPEALRIVNSRIGGKATVAQPPPLHVWATER